MARYLGIDIGSVSLNIAVIDDDRNILASRYVRTQGRPVQAAVDAMSGLLDADGDLAFDGASVTGSGKELVAGVIGAPVINEIVAHATGAWTVRPDVASIIEIGGQDSKFIQVGRDQAGVHYLKDHAFNELCAAGTGAFLDQQASRLGLGLDDFSQQAFLAEKPARLSGRCSVFAKSDMIHLQQKATPVGEIAAGLCFALARNYLATLCRGRHPVAPVLFQGGVASNQGVLRAFRELLALDESQLVRPPNHAVMGAFGAAIHAMSCTFVKGPVLLSSMVEALRAVPPPTVEESGLNPLTMPESKFLECVPRPVPGPMYLGLDIGSVSTKGVVLDSAKNCVAKAYLPTAGRPVEAIRAVVTELRDACGEATMMDGLCCTGSGRYLAAALLGGGAVMDEISAQAAGAVHFFPRADTIIEIGGQDSKYIKIADGRVERFQMNRACAAGTGAFLEEQSGRLGIDIKRDFARLAFLSKNPVKLGSRCTVFMDSDLVHHVQRGTPTEDVCAGLAYSIGWNYIEKVVGSRPMGAHVLFQGGVARNQAVHAVFSELLGRPVTVHPMPEVSGAFGAALTAMDAAIPGFAIDLKAPIMDATTDSFECRSCANMCEVRRVRLGDGRKAFFGSICGRFERDEAEPTEPCDPFVTREKLLTDLAGPIGDDIVDAPRGVIGIPFALSMTDYLPFWNTFLRGLGFKTVLSEHSRRDIVEWGLAHVPGEFCYPIKVLFGHVHSLLGKGIDRLFIPHLRMFTPPQESIARYACAYTQAAPYIVRENTGADVLALEYPIDDEIDWWIDDVAGQLSIPSAEVRSSWQAAARAQKDFVDGCRQAGSELLKRLAAENRRGCVVLGRPYNTTDRYVNLNLARRMSLLGIEPIPFDFMPLGDDPLPPMWGRVRWGYGRKLLQAARALKHHPNLGAVILTNFGCGPDSFVDQYLETELAGTPHIVLELDDHQAEAGVVTRLEAFSRTFKVRPAGFEPEILFGSVPGEPTRPLREYTYYIPSFIDHSYAFTGALRGAGCKAVLLPPTDDESWELGLQHAYGRECHPFISFAGDLLKAARRPDFVPAEACYFGPSYFGPCLLPQYLVALHLILQRAGLGDVTVMNISDPPTMKDLGRAYPIRLALGIYAIDRLFKWKTEIQPYEVNPGEVAAVHKVNLLAIEDGLANGRFFKALRESVTRFKAVELKKDGPRRPVVGIVGDVYTRVSEHSNDHLYQRLNDLGFEVWTSCSLIDVSLLGGEQLHEELHRKGKDVAGMAARIAIPGSKALMAVVDRQFPKGIRTPQERHFKDVHRVSSKYASYWIDKALSLNINRIEEFHGAGCDGVINAMCHNCMLGNVSASLSASMRRDMDEMPLCNLVFEGLKSTHSTNRLEAFAHQVISALGPDGREDPLK
jgi:predicted CoA-substrate-specific enzyme activase